MPRHQICKGMGKRGKPSSWTFELQLRRRIQDCTTTTANSISVEQLVDRLRAYHPDYRRHKLLPFTRHVKQALDSITPKPQTPTRPSSSTTDHDDDDDGDYRSPSRKRPKKIDPSEQRLQDLETQHILRKRTQNQEDESGSGSSSSSDDDEEDDSAVSTSDDAVYGEESEPKFDLMQAIIRKKYTDSVKSKVKEKKQENVELEVVNNGKEGSKKVDLMREDKGKRGGSTTTLKKSNKVSDEGVEEKVKEGPRFKDLGGMDKVIDELKMEVMVPLYHPELPQVLGVRPMAGILLHGPPGCGKTKLAHAIANEAGVPFYKISATELVSGISGASEENIRELFSKAYRTAPAIVFIDEIDAIASKRENLQREMERRIVTQLMTCMDESHNVVQPADTQSNSENSDSKAGYVLVIGATNRPDAVDPALRRPGRFDREIALGVPDENARIGILTVLTSNMKLEGSFDLLKIARSTPGFVGADLAALANKAGNLAMKRVIDQRKLELSKESKDGQQGEEWLRNPWSSEEMEKLSITMEDFEEAAKMVQPSSRREGFSSIPDVKWEDVGGLDLLRHEFDRYIVRRIKHPEDYEEFGLDTETGFLLYGPPGCGKTLIAKAVANEAGANFIHIKGPELLNKYVGESELQVRMIFTRARTCAPCIVFFDEVDALTTKRGKEGGWVVERLLNQLLIELHGADQRKGVFVIGATNRPEVMDPAVLRPGRFGKLLYVPLPSPEQRGLILKALGRKKPINADVDLISIGKKEACANLSGADLSALMNEAAMAALDERLALAESCSGSTALTINAEHFEQALTKVSPSVSDKQKEYYDRLSEHFKAT